MASLLHDDVIDEASTRRGVLSLNASVGNKTAILAGDYLLARTSVTLAALKNTEIVELFAQVLENLVAGEIMQVGTRTPHDHSSRAGVMISLVFTQYQYINMSCILNVFLN